MRENTPLRLKWWTMTNFPSTQPNNFILRIISSRLFLEMLRSALPRTHANLLNLIIALLLSIGVKMHCHCQRWQQILYTTATDLNVVIVSRRLMHICCFPVKTTALRSNNSHDLYLTQRRETSRKKKKLTDLIIPLSISITLGLPLISLFPTWQSPLRQKDNDWVI